MSPYSSADYYDLSSAPYVILGLARQPSKAIASSETYEYFAVEAYLNR